KLYVSPSIEKYGQKSAKGTIMPVGTKVKNGIMLIFLRWCWPNQMPLFPSNKSGNVSFRLIRLNSTASASKNIPNNIVNPVKFVSKNKSAFKKVCFVNKNGKNKSNKYVIPIV